jgi:hypothetical protein
MMQTTNSADAAYFAANAEGTNFAERRRSIFPTSAGQFVQPRWTVYSHRAWIRNGIVS